ncbi:MAG TPA: bis(5'-nucleosyl)-tetraphosphatase (symmetrical) YqeK [Candidatus Acidoferrales bacterium]|nr:bis(5'-nucleosyl)-tetraphosphatase (symmetrical) YqeK [Candidatus Acidoferrales bacterium]
MRAHLDQDHRYEHSVRVARAAELLAQRHRVDANKARLAGLLHDLARLYSGPRLLEECERREIPIGEFERHNPIVLHAPLSAALAREEFGVDDSGVLSAIAKHTLGDAEMSALDCVVYLADSLEPGRDFPQREGLWELALSDLPAAMAATIVASIEHLHQNGREPAPQTLAALRTFETIAREGVTPSLN